MKITSPGQSPFNSPSLYVNIRATILNVISPNNITFKLNGVIHNNFTFSGNIFEANNILIKEGNKTIHISGKNSAGVDSDQTIISFKKPTQNIPPKIVALILTYKDGELNGLCPGLVIFTFGFGVTTGL